MKAEWFSTWFDSPYYHSLYRNRNKQEAVNFINLLADKLLLTKNVKILDLACGKGRHAITLNNLGATVIGYDLSSQSISHANKYINDTLHFTVHDMRTPFPDVNFNYILNLFTSFGYFSDLSQNAQVLQNINQSLVAHGTFVIDFMNIVKVIPTLVPLETKVIDNVQYNIKRSVTAGNICKYIHVVDGEKEFHFEEKVQALSFKDIELLLKNAGFTINSVYGNYSFQSYMPLNADRLIIIAKKQ